MQLRSELLVDKIITVHPDNGIRIKHPHKPSPEINWLNIYSIATIIPGQKFSSFLDGYFRDRNFQEIEFSEPDLLFNTNAAGAIVENVFDDRIFVIHPTNEYKGLKTTFPKGRIEKGHSPRETAIKETLEETGLRVVLTSFLCDITTKNNSVIRYYKARRVGGHPSDMGWESQAVSLVPKERLREVLHSKDDQLILDKFLRD